MASASTVNEWGEMDDYTEDELAEIVQEIEKYEKEQLEESDIEVGEGLDGEEEEQSDPEDDVPLATLQTTWRPAAPPTVRAFTEATGPSHTLPENAKPLDYFFLFLPQSFFVTIAEETNRYADQKIAARGTPDPLWEKNYSGRNACLPVGADNDGGEATATPVVLLVLGSSLHRSVDH